MLHKTIQKPLKPKVGVSSKIMKFKFMQGINGKEETNTLADQIQAAKEAQKAQEVEIDEEEVETTGKNAPITKDALWTFSSGLDDLIADDISSKKINFYKKIKFNRAAPINAKAEGMKVKYDKPKPAVDK